MKHVAAALLIALSGKEISEKSLNEVLASVGIKSNPTVVSQVVNACKGKKPEELIAQGLPKLSAAVAAVSGAAHVDEKPDTKAKKEEPKKKEAPKVVEEEEEAFGFGDLF